MHYYRLKNVPQKRVEQFTKKRLLSREVNIYDPIQRITIATLFKKKTEKGNICPQRRLLGCWIICEKIALKIWSLRLSFNNRPTNSLHTWRGIVSTKNQVSFQKLFYRVTKTPKSVKQIQIPLSFTTWKFLFQTLVNVLRTQEAEETVLVSDNYNNNNFS